MRHGLSPLKRLLVVAALAAGLIQPLAAHAQGAWKPNSDDAVLFDLRLGQHRLGDGIRGYQTPKGVCVDFADIIMALDLPIRLDKKLRRATGWAFAESRSLLVDREAFTVQIMNSKQALAADAIFDAPEGWCTDTKAFGTWLGLAFEPDLANAVLTIRSKDKLPVELAAERRSRAARVRPETSFDLATLPQAKLPFRGVRTPSVDVVLQAGGLRDGRGKMKTDLRWELFASGEVGPVAYDARLASTDKGTPDSLRLRAYRIDPKGQLLGFMKATQVAAGDVSGFSTPLVSQSTIGRGAMITNRPIDRPDSFDRVDFRGELPSGWDAELYRNGQLIAFAVDRSDGRYAFLDVPLQYGQNRFEVVLYGPQGQIRREERVVPVGLDSIPPRKTYYWAGINQDGRDLIDIGNANRFGTGRWRGSAGFERGLDARTSVSASVHSLYLREVGRRNFVEGALRRAIGPALAQFGASLDSQGGYALTAQALAQFGRTYVSGETIWAGGGYQSDRVLRNVSGQHRLSVDHSVRVGRGIVPVHVEARYTTRTTGQATLEIANRVSATLGRYLITGELAYRDDKVPFGPDPPGRLEAAMLGNARIGKVRLRGEARFRIAPDAQFEQANLVAEWQGKGDGRRAADWRAEIGYDKPFDRARVGLGYVRRFDRLALTASAEAASDGSVAAGLNIAFSIGPDPRRGGGVRMTSSRLAANGQVLARVFRDANADGIRQADEPYEKDVQLAAGRAPVDRLTDDNGETIIEDLEPFRPVLIGIDAGSLPDPLIQPATIGVVVTPRPGITATVDLPLVGAGEIDGTLVRDGGNGVEGVDLELVDVSGRAIATTRSDFDGFFLFESVPYGRYTLRVVKLSADAARIDAGLGKSAVVSGASPSIHLGAVIARPPPERRAEAPGKP